MRVRPSLSIRYNKGFAATDPIDEDERPKIRAGWRFVTFKLTVLDELRAGHAVIVALHQIGRAMQWGIQPPQKPPARHVAHLHPLRTGTPARGKRPSPGTCKLLDAAPNFHAASGKNIGEREHPCASEQQAGCAGKYHLIRSMITKKARPPVQGVASFLVDPDGGHAKDEPSDTAIRLAWMLLALLRHNRVDSTTYVRTFQMSEYTFRRDVRRLKAIGRQCGFKISPLRKGVLTLAAREARLTPLLQESAQLLELVRAMAKTFGAPVLAALEPSLGLGNESLESRPFLLFSAPRLVEDSEVGRLFGELRKAHDAQARVRFTYFGRDDALSEREVEPYGVVWNAGRFYLIAYDISPRKAWRQFALDRIRGPLLRAGTFIPRNIPAPYVANDALGLFKANLTTDVTIELSSAIAVAVTCRLWQAAQRVKRLPGGRARITFSVGDVNEAVRWAMSFGADAQVVSPPEALRLAADTAERLVRRYATARVDTGSIERTA